MAENLLLDNSKKIARETVLLCKELQRTQTPVSLVDQLLRAGTSVGANVAEAQYAQSKLDFISKLEIALKECHETQYWLELLIDTEYVDILYSKPLLSLINSTRRILISSIKTVKEKLENTK